MPTGTLISLGHWNASRIRTAGEGGYSPVFASRAAVPHPAAVDRRSAPALLAAAMPICALRLAGGKSLLSVNSDRSATDGTWQMQIPEYNSFYKSGLGGRCGAVFSEQPVRESRLGR